LTHLRVSKDGLDISRKVVKDGEDTQPPKEINLDNVVRMLDGAR
jgi:hypothetical protein